MAPEALRVGMVAVPTVAAPVLSWPYFLLTCLTHLERSVKKECLIAGG